MRVRVVVILGLAVVILGLAVVTAVALLVSRDPPPAQPRTLGEVDCLVKSSGVIDWGADAIGAASPHEAVHRHTRSPVGDKLRGLRFEPAFVTPTSAEFIYRGGGGRVEASLRLGKTLRGGWVVGGETICEALARRTRSKTGF